MKKKALLTILVLALCALILSLSACADKKNEGQESGTLDEKQHLAASEESSAETVSETESETETVTLPQTEKEVETEKETEAVTEKAPLEKVESLRYVSYGNGTCGVSGIGSCTDLFIVIPERSPDGEIVTAIEDRAFYGNRDIKAVEIPSTISSIGDRAFADCPSLVYISVDKNNKAFTDISGVLYTSDKSTLLLFPAAAGNSTIEISKNVTSIADMAFFGCRSLETIQYGGSISDWGKIKIGEQNYGLYTASLSCTAEK